MPFIIAGIPAFKKGDIVRNTSHKTRGYSTGKRIEDRSPAFLKYTLTRWMLPAYIVGVTLISIVSILLSS